MMNQGAGLFAAEHWQGSRIYHARPHLNGVKWQGMARHWFFSLKRQLRHQSVFGQNSSSSRQPWKPFLLWQLRQLMNATIRMFNRWWLISYQLTDEHQFTDWIWDGTATRIERLAVSEGSGRLHQLTKWASREGKKGWLSMLRERRLCSGMRNLFSPHPIFRTNSEAE